jgi:RimJ/RimL family protein N-acetyltransferase
MREDAPMVKVVVLLTKHEDLSSEREALAGVARWVLTEGGMRRAWLTVNTGNAASARVAEKAGFRREAMRARLPSRADHAPQVGIAGQRYAERRLVAVSKRRWAM